MGMDADTFGWASVQLDGGIESATAKIQAWFLDKTGAGRPVRGPVGLERVTLGLTAIGPVPAEAAAGMAEFLLSCLASGATCVISGDASLLEQAEFSQMLAAPARLAPNLPYGGRPEAPGLYLMHMPSAHTVETQTGLGAAGAHLMLAYSDARPVHAHPFIPVLHLGSGASSAQPLAFDLELKLGSAPSETASQLMDRVLEVLDGEHIPRAAEQGDYQFQLARGPQGISL
jgi:hypothetical protein